MKLRGRRFGLGFISLLAFALLVHYYSVLHRDPSAVCYNIPYNGKAILMH
jgi:hypothetical protein